MKVYSSCLTVAALCALHTAGAQQSWSPFVSLGSPSSAALAPGALLEYPGGSLLARSSATFDAGLPQIGDADLASRFRLGALGRWESSVFATGHYDRGLPGTPAWANAAFRLQLGSTSPAQGLQLGLGADSWRANRDAELVPAASVSAWLRRFGLSFSAEVSTRMLPGARLNLSSDTLGSASRPSVVDHYTQQQYFDSLADSLITISVPHFRDASTNTFSEARTFGETSLRVSGMLLSLGLDAQIGRTMGTKSASRTFGSVILTRWLSSSLAVTGGMVVQAPEPGGLTGRSGVLLGLRLGTGSHGPPTVVNAPKTGVLSTSVRVADGQTTLEVRAAGAAHVEVSGDFTHWLPVGLERAGGDRWRLTTALSPGIHRLVIRVDGGAWLPPPGLPQTADPYEGNVGVIVSS